MALSFRDSGALVAVLRSGVCPADVLARPANVARRADGAIVLAPERSLPAAAIKKLESIGVAVDAPLPRDARAVRCWMEALAPVKVTVPEIPSLVMITTSRAGQLVDVAAELVRLGCDRQELLVSGDAGIVRVVDPPTYTVVRALDREAGLRVYAPDPVGQDATWIELGYRHPMADQLRAEPRTMLLVGNEGWRVIPDGDWLGLDAVLELVVPADKIKLAQAPLPPRRKVPLRLSSGRRDAPSLWVIRNNAVAAIDKLLAYLPEDIVGRLTFAVTGVSEANGGVGGALDPRGGPTVIVRARTGRNAPPDLSLAAEEYAPLHQMPDVYAPAGSIVEPPLRRERLRHILGVGNNEVMWLAPDPGGFRVERIADGAFAPLLEWAEYVIHASVPTLQPWMRATVFDFAPFVSTGLEWASKPPDATDDDEPRRRKKQQRPSARYADDDEPVAAPQPTVRPAAPAAPKATKPAEAPTTYVAIDAELAALETEFVALDAPADAPERLELFERLGNCYARLKRRREAGLCYSRAVWEASGAEAQARLDAWIASDLATTKPETALGHALGNPNPAQDEVRMVAALAARQHPGVARDPHRVTRWLDVHDAELDARSLWLARSGLAALAGGDPLGLAHARDRILARLAGGLPVERELPSFLRLAGRSGALGNASGEQLGTALDELAGRIVKTKRKRSPVEAPAANTQAYVNFQLALGYARVGNHDKARTLVREAQEALQSQATDSVHAYLIAAYSARVDQAIAGISAETPLPEEHGARLAALDRVARYKVDRLREASLILEPLERPDAIGAFSKKLTDARGPEFAALRAMSESSARAKAIAVIVESAEKADGSERERLVDGVLDVLLELPESAAVPLLMRTIPLIDHASEGRRAMLYAEALVAAGHFGRTELVRELLDKLSIALRGIGGVELDRVLQQSLRALRRIGLRHEIAELLAQAEHAIPAARADALRGRLALASGMAFLGESHRALPIYDQARKALTESMTMTNKLELTRSLALAYAQAPLSNALAGISELANQLKDITDSFGTNSHYCLSVLHFVDSLVLGITSDDLALGEAGRRFVEDDEHLIRRRLHRDLSGGIS